MKVIGGYFGLEACSEGNVTFHDSFYAFNSARNALLALLNSKHVAKIWLPYYCCPDLSQLFKRNNIEVCYYNISKELKIESLPEDRSDVLLYVNYFGVMDGYIKKLALNLPNLIVDNAHAFYSKPVNGLDTLYSPRKFFGVSDGGFIFSNADIDITLYKRDRSYERCSYLLKRADLLIKDGYQDYKLNEEKIDLLPAMKMSHLTRNLIRQVDHEKAKELRRENFAYLNSNLGEINELQIELMNESVPMVYPLLKKSGKLLKKRLIDNQIFVATYWPKTNNCSEIERYLIDNMIALPIDQRYSIVDMKIIVNELKTYLAYEK